MSLDFANIKKILIPIDGSDYSTRAAELGISVAKLVGAQVMVVYVIDTVVLDQIAKVSERENVERELKQDGERYINYVLRLGGKAKREGCFFACEGTTV